MIDGIEIAFQIHIDHPLVSIAVAMSQLRSLLVVPPGTEAMRTIQKIRLKQRLNDELYRHLDHPILHSRNAQRTSSGFPFGYVHPSDYIRLISFGLQFLLNFFQKVLFAASFYFGDCFPVNSGRAPVGTHPFPCLLYGCHVTYMGMQQSKFPPRISLGGTI